MLSIIEKVLLLQEVEILKSVSTEHLSQIAIITHEVEYQEGHTIYYEGEIATTMYVVINGEVRIYKGDQEVLVAKPKSAFGVWALFDEEERVVSATCLTDSRLLCLEKNDFHELLADHSEISRSVLMAMSKRLRSLVAHVSLANNNEK